MSEAAPASKRIRVILLEILESSSSAKSRSMHHSARESTTGCDAARLAEPHRSFCTALPRCTRQPLCAGSFAEQLESRKGVDLEP